MKRMIIAIMVAVIFCTLALAQKRTQVLKDSIEQAKTTASQTEQTTNDEDSDTTIVTDWQDTPDSSSAHANFNSSHDDNFPFNMMGGNFGASSMLVPIVAIIMIFGLPVFVIFIAFFFKYKSKKAKYRLVEQALAAGQPIPESIFKEQMENNNTRVKGIKNAFLGFGLFIFLWALTGEFGLGCVGLLIMFTGLGQIVIHYTQKSSSTQNPYAEQIKIQKYKEENIDEKFSEKE
ncbi:DUF6249 domain-containing protein [uncultured Bacteroides sp.]|uniref:DUF6249 domain-containing protein n=1 Tax=uncultured Bacteroides sp. TaxID=162156 RepID=UPI002AABEBA9|nr:DUF6249 domain-containing protein [uncultured Bacteroides sp.]